MRIKNKELRQRRHRKEQKIKEMQREVRKTYESGAKPAGAAAAPKAKAPAKAAAAKPAADKKPAAPKKPKTEGEVAAKKAPAAKKKEETATEAVVDAQAVGATEPSEAPVAETSAEA